MSFTAQHFEGDLIEFIVNRFAIPNEAKLDAFVTAEAPAGAAALLALIEKDDAGLGFFASSTINGLINSFGPEIDAEIEALAAQGITGVPALIKGALNLAAKLKAK